MRVIIDGWAWLEKAAMQPHHIEQTKRQLTLIPKVYDEDDPAPVEVFRDTEEWLGVPRQFYLRNARKRQKQLEWRVTKGDLSAYHGPVEFSGALRDYQKEPFECLMRELESPNCLGGIFRADTGFGKTCVACAAIAKLSVPTLVFVHNRTLLEQWEASFAQFLPEAKVGKIHEDTVEYEGCTVVIAMVQSVWSKRDSLPQGFATWPGLVVFDEVHHYSSDVWGQLVTVFPAMYRLGLSATLRRGDNLEDIFFWHIGEVLYSAKVTQLEPAVKMVRTGFTLPTSRSINPDMVTENVGMRYLIRDMDRNRMLVNYALRAYNTHRKVLLLTKRRDHVATLYEMLTTHSSPGSASDTSEERLRRLAEEGDMAATEALQRLQMRKGKAPVVSTCVGGVTGKTLERAKSADIIVATAQYVKEGFDVPRLDTLILAAPMVEVEQAVGRIMRLHDDKQDPIVIDLVDDGVGVFAAYARKRQRFYEQKGYL